MKGTLKERDNGHKYAASIKMCETHCLSNPACNSFTYDKFANECQLGTDLLPTNYEEPETIFCQRIGKYPCVIRDMTIKKEKFKILH